MISRRENVEQKLLIQVLSVSSSSSRVDPDCISPDVKNSIHVGDRILEINGTPVHNVPLDEVFIAHTVPGSLTSCTPLYNIEWNCSSLLFIS